MSTKSARDTNEPETLESKKYRFAVPGSMPILEFQIFPSKDMDPKDSQSLRLELYNPLAGEIFEAKFPGGRIEADSDGSITYFSNNAEKLNVSLFLGYNLMISMNRKTGSVLIRTPSKIKSVKEEIRSRNAKSGEVVSDSLSLELE